MLSEVRTERNALTIEEAVRALTHRCRFYPTLKLRPQACIVRKSQRQKIFNGKSYSIFWQCADCPGPLPLENEPAPLEPREEKTCMKKREYGQPSTCRTCGLSPGFTRENGTDVRFYPSRPDECVACIKKKQAARKGLEQKGWSPVVPNGIQVEPPPDPPVEVERWKYDCPEHGPHNGRIIGHQHSKVCPECFRRRMSVKMKQVREDERKNRGNGNPEKLPGWVFAWCDEQAAQHGISPLEYLIGLVGEKIPAEWFKEWLMKGASQ